MATSIAELAKPVDRTARVNAANQRLVRIIDQSREYTFWEVHSKLVEAGVTNRLTGIIHTLLYVSGINVAMNELDTDSYVDVQPIGNRYKLSVRRFDQEDFD